MKLISQHVKAIMEECKIRAREAGLRFSDESLEYVVSNQDILELTPKYMVPTLYDYWVHDVRVIHEYQKYQLQPQNPYEIVVNSRPALSFYNENNPDWLNIMIFYHVLAHIDFFQNNCFFAHTWNDDFVGQALADKRLIQQLRSAKGRWVDYVIEFSRGIDNLLAWSEQLYAPHVHELDASLQLHFYFNVFLQFCLHLSDHQVYREVDRYNACCGQYQELAESVFLAEVKSKYPRFSQDLQKYYTQKPAHAHQDLLQFLLEHSPLLKKEENQWMRSVMSIVRNTALYFSPQIRTKILNEGWASYWHDRLFCCDERIHGHEVNYAKVNAMVTAMNPLGLNPYALGLRLVEYVEELEKSGKLTAQFPSALQSAGSAGSETQAIFLLRKQFCDFMLLHTFVDQSFVNAHNLVVVGKRFNPQRESYEYFIKSKKAQDYKNMLLNSLYHPPKVFVDLQKTCDTHLHLVHQFEGKALMSQFIAETLMGIEYLWGNEVALETFEYSSAQNASAAAFIPVVYLSKKQKTLKKNL